MAFHPIHVKPFIVRGGVKAGRLWRILDEMGITYIPGDNAAIKIEFVEQENQITEKDAMHVLLYNDGEEEWAYLQLHGAKKWAKRAICVNATGELLDSIKRTLIQLLGAKPNG